MELNKKAAYLQGLVDGLGVDESTKEGKIIKAMAALLGEMADAIAAMAARPPFAVAVNTVFVPNTHYAEQLLQADDRVEIISPVTGG